MTCFASINTVKQDTSQEDNKMCTFSWPSIAIDVWDAGKIIIRQGWLYVLTQAVHTACWTIRQSDNFTHFLYFIHILKFKKGQWVT